MSLWKEDFKAAHKAWRCTHTSNTAGYARNYRRSHQGKLYMTYGNMYGRVSGIQKSKAHIYEGLALLTKEAFYAWSKSCGTYDTLYAAWAAAGFPRDLPPSIDRIDEAQGYVIENMQWITHAENSSRANHRRHYE